MAQQYNFPTGNSGTDQDTPPNVPEDFDFTSFLLDSRPPVPTNTTDRTVPAEGWPQRVQDVKQTGNPASPHYGMPNSYTGWSPMGTERTDLSGIGNGTSGTSSSIYGSNLWMPTDANSVYHGANPSFNPTNLGYPNSNSDFENNLRGIWGNSGTLGGQVTSNNTDFGSAAEGRDMYEYAWNEWERPLGDGNNAANRASNAKSETQQNPGAAQVNGKYSENEVEDLRATLFGGNRKERGESSISAHSSNSWHSKGNTSAKDGCSVSSKSYSDIMKESKQPSKTQAVREKAQQKSNSMKPQNLGFQKAKSSSSTVPSHYQKSVTPPPGFESSTLHEPKGPETDYGLDDFVGTSTKVQRWLQHTEHSQDVDEDSSNVTKQKKSKKKKKAKKPDPLTGSVASFIRDWNSETTESTDPSSLDDCKSKVPFRTAIPSQTDSTTESSSPSHTSAFDSTQTFKQDQKVQDIPVQKTETAFFDPKRIFQEPTSIRKSEERTKTAPPSKGSSSTTTSKAHNFFDPKRIFQSKAPVRNDDSKPMTKSTSASTVKATSSSSDRIHNSDQTTPTLQEFLTKMAKKSSTQNSADTPATHQTNKGTHTTNTPVEELLHSTSSAQDFVSPPPSSGSNWKHYLSGSGSGDNKGSINNKGSSNNSSSPGMESMDHGKVRSESSSRTGSGARPDMSSSESQNAKTTSFHNYQKESSSSKEKKEAEMRTRSQSRRDAEQAAFDHHCQHHRFVPQGNGDGIHIPTRQSFSPQNENYPSRQRFSPFEHDFPNKPSFSSHVQSSKSPTKQRRNFSFDVDDDENDNTKDYPGSSYRHGIPRPDKSSKKKPSFASSASSKHSGKSRGESEPGWKKNKTSRNVRSEARSSKQGRERRDAGGDNCNGSVRSGRHRETRDKTGRNRQDSDGTSSETAAHYYDADQFYQWMKAIAHFAIWIGGFIVFLFLVLTAYLFSTCKVWIEYILHIAKELWISISELLALNNPESSPRWWNSLRGWFKKGKDGRRSRHGSDGSRPSRGKHAETIELPTTSSEAISRIMACDPEDAYAVLGVGDNSMDDDIKKYYRKQCVMVHPDKCNLRHANDAFQILQKGYDTLTDPEKRYDLDQQRASACEAEDMINDIYEKMREAMNTLNCNMCDNKHKRYIVDRPCYAARYCSRHDSHHSAGEGDMWAETTHLGFKWHYYACMDNGVYDITEWAKCQNLRHMESNTCEVRYRIGSNRSRRPQPPPFMPSEPPPWHQQHQQGSEDFRNGDEEINDLLRHLFGDRANRTANDPHTSGQSSNRSSRRSRRHRKKKY